METVAAPTTNVLGFPRKPRRSFSPNGVKAERPYQNAVNSSCVDWDDLTTSVIDGADKILSIDPSDHGSEAKVDVQYLP